MSLNRFRSQSHGAVRDQALYFAAPLAIEIQPTASPVAGSGMEHSDEHPSHGTQPWTLLWHEGRTHAMAMLLREQATPDGER